MKKILSKLALVLVVGCLLFTAVGCGGTNWKKEDVTLKEWGKVVSNGGFVAETENYFYYINGLGNSTADNTFGNPQKGALCAVSKADLESGKTEDAQKCIVVPKLFVASDYKGGIYISGDYVYYGSPSVDKNSSGKTANDELHFMRTKLDGTDSTSYFKTQAISDEYRIVEKDGTVYFVVYDSKNTELVSYNTATKEKTVLAKTDEKTSGSESLKTYKFGDFAKDGAAVFFTNTVYTESYSEQDAAANSNYTRTAASYNKLYAYKAGEEVKEIFDGEETKTSYEISLNKGGYVYYTATKAVSMNETVGYVASVEELYNGEAGSIVLNSSYADAKNVIVGKDEVYTVSSDNGDVRKVSLIDNGAKAEKKVASINSASTLLFVNGEYLYYLNGNTRFARIKLSVENAKEQVISDAAVPTEWYMPILRGEYAFYVDNSEIGCNYVKTVKLSDANLKDKEEDDETVYYFDGVVSLAIMAADDKPVYFKALVDDVTANLKNGQIVFDKDDDGNVILKDGKPVCERIEKAEAAYSALTDDMKKKVEEATLTNYKNYSKALEISKTLYGLNDFDNLSSAEKDALRDTAYADSKSAIESLKKSKDYTASVVRALFAENMNWYYQKATQYFEN